MNHLEEAKKCLAHSENAKVFDDATLINAQAQTSALIAIAEQLERSNNIWCERHHGYTNCHICCPGGKDDSQKD